METDLLSRMVSVEHQSQSHGQRLSALETWQRQREIDSARNDERWTAMDARIDNRFSGLEESVRDIKTSLSRINWLVIGGIISGVIAFIIRGGISL